MIISFPTQQGLYSVCLNAALLKTIACMLAVLLLIAGYALVEIASFILTSTPEQFLRIVIFTAFLGLLVFGVRFLLSKKLTGGAI